jgi:hypothetical protein
VLLSNLSPRRRELVDERKDSLCFGRARQKHGGNRLMLDDSVPEARVTLMGDTSPKLFRGK